MLRTRLWMGACLIALAVAMLVADRAFRPWYPFLFLFFALVGVGATIELLGLLPFENRPGLPGCLAGVLVIICANWPAHVGYAALGTPLEAVVSVFALVVLAFFLIEMARFREPGHAVVRIALGIWVLVYLGILPSFLAQLRWQPDSAEAGFDRGAAAVALAIFLPKLCDIGAYFSGRLFGRHKITPVLSPKKTAEGFAGGVLVAAVTALLFNRAYQLLGSDVSALACGLTLGVAGIYGDLAESLIKRDSGHKDAGATVPGFGGVLDVIDSIVFAAPVAYWWLR